MGGVMPQTDTGLALSHFDTLKMLHEMRQPLTAMLADAEAALRWMNKGSADASEARLCIERIVRNCHRTADAIKDLSGELLATDAVLQGAEINQIVCDLVTLMTSAFQSHGITVEVDLAEGLPTCQGNRLQLHRVIGNLVTNGIEAIAPGTDRPRILSIRTGSNEHADLLISVEDSGLGIDPMYIDRIFDPLFTTKEEGTGLGLAICRAIIEAHGGCLWASPREPHGSAFHFIIPAARATGSTASFAGQPSST
ncbi:hypothetical protein GCM10007301_50140 [Azorhizobium oxalatiphilum]|uniref:histidine kinase n=1 Tax=Azorhizobium oxalatiphilum TaxID=980631 RepID=A0A917FHU0_9HYPH|nr:sensor histidine kinase [Azorhizobium oxalatiphilum]GGF84147.1 hypothetical protein GCM10007301_50140 [Azorhizobium oxalatiphilum]